MYFSYLFQRLAALLATSILVAPGLPQTALADDSLPGFSASYAVRYGILRGTMTLELEPRQDGYRYETALQPRGIVGWLRRGEIRETTVVEATGDTIFPLEYAQLDTIAKPERRVRYVFDRRGGRVTGEYKHRLIDEPLRDAGQDRISAHIAIMLALRSGKDIAPFSVFDRGRWRDLEVDVETGSRSETPFGTFETVGIRYASVTKNKSWSLYCAPALEYAPVMIVYEDGGKVKSRAVLTAFSTMP